jgi:hypothetical protein
MMLLFSCGCYFAYRATEAAVEGRIGVMPGLTAGFFFCLLALAHWIGVWSVIGYAIYAAIVFAPRGLVAGIVLLLMLLAAIFPMLVADRVTGSPFGTAFLVLYNGLAGGSETVIMRLHDLDQQPLTLEGLLGKVLRTMLLQGTDILPFLGGIVAAPLFLLALLHPFKRASIARFRWAILGMWLLAVLGMALFGVDSEGLHPNQVHLVFAPVMTAYGLAFLSILWNRLVPPQHSLLLANAHFVLVILLSALPLVLALPQRIRLGMTVGEKGLPHWPPYYPTALNLRVKEWVDPDQIVVADQPWAVAWYADRTKDLKTPFAGLLVSPASYGGKDLREIGADFGDFASLIMDGRGLLATLPRSVSLFEQDSKLSAIAQTYRYRYPLVELDMVYYSEKPIVPSR